MKNQTNLIPVIPEVDKALIRKELSPDRFVRKTNKLGNEVYIINHHNSPNTMLEIGRLRELSFRESGGGTGMEVDIDEYDTSDRCYQQMIIYNPEEQEIVGGYRFIKCKDAYNEKTKEYELSTLHYFDFSQEFIADYLPNTLELGRSWIQPKLQSSRSGVFALDNLWDGLGAIMYHNADIDYLFGKVTMYPEYGRESRDAVIHFMNYYFPDKKNLVIPKKTLGFDFEKSHYKDVFQGKSYKDGHKSLNKFVRERKLNIPPLINSYMNLSETMKTFGTVLNDDFGAVEETGILITIKDLHEKVKERYVIVKKD